MTKTEWIAVALLIVLTPIWVPMLIGRISWELATGVYQLIDAAL